MQRPQLQAFLPTEVSLGRVASYAFLPGIFPRLRSLAGVFAKFLFTFTQIFGTVGLIERNHPCLQPQNMGLYRFRDIVGLAFYNMWQDRKNLNKIVMFFSVVGTFVLTMGLLITSIAMVALRVNQAKAQYFGDTVSAPYGNGGSFQSDWAYQFLSEVFGDVGVNFWGGLGTAPPIRHIIFHDMLQSMFSTYSQALLVIAVFMIIYHIVVMVAESARTGQPFGQNFNSVWAPVRLALAIGLLVPITNGYNTAQLIAFQVSNWGSALATNVWNSALDFDQSKFVGYYQPPEIYDVMRAAFDGYACLNVLEQVGRNYNTTGEVQTVDDTDSGYTYLYFASVKRNNFLWFDKTLSKDFCGVIKVPMTRTGLTDFKIKELSGSPTGAAAALTNTVVTYGYLGRSVTNGYYNAMNGSAGSPGILQRAENVAGYMGYQLITDRQKTVGDVVKAFPALAEMQRGMLQKYRDSMGMNATTGKYLDAFSADATSDSTAIKTILQQGKKYGWAGAGSFMMTIAQVNRTVSDSIARKPEVVALPRTLVNNLASPYKPNASVQDESNDVLQSARYQSVVDINEAVSALDRWFREWPITQGLPNSASKRDRINQSEWDQQLKDFSTREQNRGDGDLAGPVAKGLFNWFLPGTPLDINPLARIISLGNILIASGVLAGIASVVATGFPTVSNYGLGTILLTIAGLCASGGYTLAIVLPLALFTNFMFAVLEWVVSVFEAVVGMPLWCLSFITVDGEGIGGKAMGGVMKLFELMLRPTIIVIATVGSFLMFSAAVHFLDKSFGSFLDSYYGATSVVANASMALGSIFIYVLTVYSIGNSCFKMIPTIANNFMRWIDGPNGFSGTMQAEMSSISGAAITAGLAGAAYGIGKGVQDGRNRKRDKADSDRERALSENERRFDRNAREGRHQDLMNALQGGGRAGGTGGGTPAGQNPNPYGGGNIGFNRGGNNPPGGGGSAPPGSTP